MKLQIDKKFTDEIRKAQFEIDTLSNRQEHIVKFKITDYISSISEVTSAYDDGHSRFIQK